MFLRIPRLDWITGGAEIFENDQWGRNIWGSPTDSNADFAWLQHMYKSMRPGKGRCAVVMPQGVLFHGGREGDIRKINRLGNVCR